MSFPIVIFSKFYPTTSGHKFCFFFFFFLDGNNSLKFLEDYELEKNHILIKLWYNSRKDVKLKEKKQ